MDERIKTILEYGIMAPSGDNCQPWLFKVDGLKVDLFNDPEKDTSLYNLKQRASLIAHGALLENIKISSPSVGLQAGISLLPTSTDPNHIATITFQDAETAHHPYFDAIPERHTNRESYQPVDISTEQLKTWQNLVAEKGQKLYATKDPDSIKSLSGLLSLNDRLVFSVQDLHKFLFEQIRWNDIEARQTGDGLDIKTLGLNAIDKQAFRFLKNWSLVALFNKIGFSSIIQMKAKQLTNSASAIAVLAIPGNSSLDYLQGGMLWQRMQLQLATEGLTSQPIAGLACLMQSQVEGILSDKLTAGQQAAIEKTRKELLKKVVLDEESIILTMFRIGKGREVTRALRKPMNIFC